jgi:SAM-dependent methyltransferase
MNTFFQINGPWLRDEYLCLHCRSIPRQRHLQYVLDTQFPGWENLVIHESSPTNNLVARWCSQYSSSQYFDGVRSGALVDEVRCENLECLSFADDSIDLFITQDVFEHVFHPELAVCEIRRVLKPGGAHIFTVPKLGWIPLSEPRARLSASGIEYLKEASYHGNPVGDGRALVTWDYGADFERLIDGWSGLSTAVYAEANRAIGVDGEFRDVFVSRKPL